MKDSQRISPALELAIWSGVHHLQRANVPGVKCRLTILKVIIPLARKLFIHAQHFYFLDVVIESHEPRVQRSCVIKANVFDIKQRQV